MCPYSWRIVKINVPGPIAERAHSNAFLNIKLEVDTDPPGGFETEAKTLLQPIPFAVKTYQQPDLFAGKLHAILQRNWKGRVKGRDYYDFVWYVARDIPVRLSHPEKRLRQSGGWSGGRALQHCDLIELLRKRFAEVDLDAAGVQWWSREFFEALLPKLKVV